MTVELVCVGEVLALQRRAVAVELDDKYEEIGVRSFGRGIFHKEPASGVDLGSKRVFRIEPGDLVISNVFAWEGAIAIASENERGKVGSHRFMTFVPVDSRIDTSWASWFFRSEPGLGLIMQASPGSAGRNRTLAIDRFEALEIPLPSIDEQRLVAKRLDRLQAVASQLARRSAHAAQMTAALAVSASLRLDLKDAAKIEAGWRKVALGEVLAASTDQRLVEPGERYRIAGIYSFGRGLIDRGAIDGAETSYKALTSLNEGDIVVSKLNGWEGAVAVVGPHFDRYCVSSEYPVFKADRLHLDPAFFSGVARSPWFWNALNSNARGSMVRRRRISSAQFLAAEIWLPPIETQHQVAEHLQILDRAAYVREQSRSRLVALIPAALNNAFVRRLDVAN
jgi:type I restriction enzyme, S subunit